MARQDEPRKTTSPALADKIGSPVNASDNPVEPYGPSLTGWYPIGDVSLSLDRLHPLSSALPNSLALTFGKNATGDVGLFNIGWWGIDVSPQTYNASFFVNAVNNTYAANQTTTFKLALRSNLTDDVWATSEIGPVGVDTFRYVQLNGTIENDQTAPDANNTFAITFDAEALRGQTLYFSLFSLFPETFKGEPFMEYSGLYVRATGATSALLICQTARTVYAKTLPKPSTRCAPASSASRAATTSRATRSSSDSNGGRLWGPCRTARAAWGTGATIIPAAWGY